MSQQNDGYYPPPSPGGSYLHPRRQQQSEQPALITTIFNRGHGSQTNTSLSSSAVNSPLSPMFSPSSANFPNAVHSMPSRTYNPRQWSQPGYAEGSRTASGAPSRGSTRESTGMESNMPSPPPPYTPPATVNPLRLARPQTYSNEVHAPSPLLSSFPSVGPSSSRSSPQVQMPPQFPPPPSKDKGYARGDRDSSRSRFSLQALTAMVKRPEHSDVPSQPNSPRMTPVEFSQRPPAGRRAVSTGGISLPSASASASASASESESQSSRRPSPESARWEPGMPLPPPPPGPPPATGRSHSLNRYGQPRPTDAGPDMSANPRPAASRRTSHTNTLGAIPPTPAGWVDDDPIPELQPTAHVPPPQVQVNTDVMQHQSTNLARRPAQREPSTDSILERRSKSKAGRDTFVGDGVGRSDSQTIPAHASNFRKPAKLVLSSTDPLLQRRLAERTERQSTTPESGQRSSGPNLSSTLTPPYTPSPDLHRKNVKRAATDSVVTTSAKSGQDSFVQASLERFHMFIQQEASSPTDRERLELFANFMVQESRVRRDRYGTAFNSMAGEIMDLTRDMWRPLSSSGLAQESQFVQEGHHESSRPSASPEGSRRSANIPTSSCSSATEFTPATDTESICDSNDHGEERPPPTPWGEKFQPSLSPIRSIPSMAVSTVPDDEDSRGRSASRWWEGSGEGSVGHGGRRLEMTKQESKYMSLHPNELIIAAQPSPSHSTSTPGTTKTSFRYGPDEYPPEKTGLHEEDATPEQTLPDQSLPTMLPSVVPWGKQPLMPPLDISRLVTMPPPFPRHYPALHNNHPSLSEIRSRHREIAEMISLRQSRPQSDSSWHNSVQASMMQACEMSIAELVRRLDEDSDGQQTTAAQTEGDERPELLEQLTLLKWIFEAREQLQKQDFDAATHRLKARSQAFTEQCRAMGDYQRQREEEQRLAGQMQQNQLYFAEQATQRFSNLLSIVERHVSRGVEVQLSAFWDIAPALLEVVQKVPIQDTQSIATCSVTIPGKEFADNPSYARFPLQYLLHTLTHAKKSTYQFIESQTNLLCLLHEVRTAAISAELRLIEIGRIMSGEDAESARQEMMEVKKLREEEETRVLKERVVVLEGQWECALGEEIERVVQRVGRFLQEQGGWEEGMDV